MQSAILSTAASVPLRLAGASAVDCRILAPIRYITSCLQSLQREHRIQFMLLITCSENKSAVGSLVTPSNVIVVQGVLGTLIVDHSGNVLDHELQV